MSYILVGAFMLLVAALAVRNGHDTRTLGFDFRGTIWEPARAILDGQSPYPAPVESEVVVGNPAVYPPLLMLVAVPLAQLSWTLAFGLWAALGLASVMSALFLVGVRDVRCYCFALGCYPVVAGLTWGNATLLLVPLVALAWRWRSHPYRPGLVLGVAIAAKLFLWPLVFWLIGTRRYRAAIAAAATALIVLLVSWAVIGFDGLTSYPDLLRIAEKVYATHSFSVATMLSAVGIDADLAARGALLVGLGLGVVALVLGRRASDAGSFSVGVLAAILGSPIVWPYYYALLLVPIAVVRPRLSAIWVALGLFFLVHRLHRPWLDELDVAAGSVACCVPDDVPVSVWITSHAPPALWPTLGYATLAAAMVLLLGWWAQKFPRRPAWLPVRSQDPGEGSGSRSHARGLERV